MGFSTKLNLVNAKFCQQDGGVLTLSGDTSIADVGRLAYLTDQTAVFNVTPRSIPDAAWITGKTNTALTNYYTKSQINNYTGETNTRFGVIESKYITGATNGLTKVGAHDVKLGGALTGNTVIGTGSNLFGVNAGNINLTGTTVNIGGTIKVTTSPATGSGSDSVLVRASDGTVKTVSGAILGDKNNIYAKTTITSNTILSTGSSYVILVSHAGLSLTVTLPSTPLNGQAFKLKDITGNALTFPITVDGNGNLIDGAASGMINTDYGAIEIMIDVASDQWYSLAFIN